MRKTKIICTLGPATDGILPEMIKAGMNVARMNFSHGSHEEHKARMDAVKAARKELGMPVGIMLDTKGPEIRTKTYKDGKIEIVEGQEFTLTTRDIEGDNTIVSITYEGLPNDVQPGTRILIDDGLVAFEVLKIVDGTDIICKALNGGPLSNRKSINVPGIKLNMKFISDKDREDIEFGLTQDIDFIAASFTWIRFAFKIPGSTRAAAGLTSSAVWKSMSATWLQMAAHTTAPGLSRALASGAKPSGASRNAG